MTPEHDKSNSSVELSTLIAGFWRLSEWDQSAQETLGFVERCIELGVTTMDHAMVYNSEPLFGKAIALNPGIREKIEIVSKFGIRPAGFGELGAKSTNHYDCSASAVIQSVEKSLQDLNTDYLDVLLIHRPDYLMDAQEISDAFQMLHSEGKVNAFGVSNFTVHQFEVLQHTLPFPLVTNQVEFSPRNMQNLDTGVFEQCSLHNIRPMLWSCLDGGRLLHPQDDKGRRILKALQQVGDEIGTQTVDQVVYAWVLSLPCKPYPLLGTSRIERVEQAVAALGLTMSREHWYTIWEASNGSPVP